MIRIKPFDIVALLDYRGIQAPNQHGRVKITALINSKKEAEYLGMANKTTWAEVIGIDENQKETPIFCGVLTVFKIKREAHECIMELELFTGTILLEGRRHLRSFQSGNLTYRDAIDTCNRGYEDAKTIMTVGKSDRLPHMMIQYHTSDWLFLKRLCSFQKSVLVPSAVGPGIKYFFGMPALSKKAKFHSSAYTIMNDGALSYIVKSREWHSIGTEAEFMEQKLVIWKVESELEGGELYHTYYLTRDMEKFVKEADRYDTAITGASLMGVVTDVADERVKVRLSEDENSVGSGERWFPFSTIYSSPDGAGWYCMPERGDTVRLYVPDENESDAYVCSAVHEKDGQGIRSNPDHKIWRNKDGKEIKLTPDMILLTNNKGNYVKLSDAAGVQIRSNHSVNIKAGGRIQISSENAEIEVSAADRIRIQQGESEMLLQDGVKVTGAKINMM